MDMADAENKITQIEKTLDELPDKITEKIKETMDLKIEVATQKIKLEFYKWLVPLILGLLGTMAGVIFQYIK